MQVKINRPIMLGGKAYAKGVHDVQVQDGERWFFDALVAGGQIVPVEKAAEKPQEPAKAPEAIPAAPEAEKPRKRAKKAD